MRKTKQATVGIQRDERYAIPRPEAAVVEFKYPNPDGRTLRLSVLDLSVSGISFLLEEELPLIVRGARLADAVVRVGQREIRGNLLVKHVTGLANSEALCGVLFHPASEQDNQALSEVIEELEQTRA